MKEVWWCSPSSELEGELGTAHGHTVMREQGLQCVLETLRKTDQRDGVACFKLCIEGVELDGKSWAGRSPFVVIDEAQSTPRVWGLNQHMWDEQMYPV